VGREHFSKNSALALFPRFLFFSTVENFRRAATLKIT
jgi:hypothetical protein